MVDPHSNTKEVYTIQFSSDVGTTPSTNANSPIKEAEYRMYGKRWLILGIFVFYSALNAAQWIQYSIIANVISKYYGVRSVFIDWTSMIYMVTYIPLIFPASYLLDLKGLRFTTIIGSFGTCLGAWIKVFSVAPNLFAVTFIGQTFAALSQVFILSVPARLAAVWFGPGQVSSACSIGVFGNQLGVAIGFLLPPMLVRNSDNIDEIGSDLRNMFITVAILTTIIFVLVLFFFSAAPSTPVSAAQAKQQEAPQEPFFNSVKALLSNWDYLKLLISYGINVGVFYAISTLLNQIVLQYYPGAELHAGRLGLMLVLSGMVGSVVSGIVLDKTHRFKETSFGLYLFSLLGMIVYTFTLNCGIAVVYASSILLGFFMTGYLPVGFEFAAELTYPEPEGTSAGILNAASQVFGIAFTSLYSIILTEVGDFWANITMCSALVVGTILTLLTKSNLKRQAAQKT
ncbi:uncharacterized MFS-type transporter C09D4.1 [Chrysoperla carnea]|uniref:uncharacterized MFS-type transporter C09D4.1 n=1 Tax=Chrysoperla carnea TaxID=189513 RepID=UPI001D073C06|nr:uncharacterized MFS-type transporter C09D4.1 [Chrysoperla carnea]XP_044744051.1 uncharacterized MFS-type transporter C09D4.1 [Chrysoperla carnea]